MDLTDIQQLIHTIREKRGHSDCTILQLCLLYGEENGELFKAIREREGLALHQHTERYSIPDEIADCFIFLSAISEYYGYDLEDVVIEKLIKDDEKVYSIIKK